MSDSAMDNMLRQVMKIVNEHTATQIARHAAMDILSRAPELSRERAMELAEEIGDEVYRLAEEEYGEN